MSATTLANLALVSVPDLPEFLLGRLAALMGRQMAAVIPAQRVALAVAAFSIFLDCLALGLGDEARAILWRGREEAGSLARPTA